MTSQIPENAQVDQRQNDKEYNFRLQQQKYERQLETERAVRMDLERKLEESRRPADDDDNGDEPYVDHKKLDKKLAKYGQQQKQETQNEIQRAVQVAIKEERKENWLKQNGDFYEVLKHADKFADADPELAEAILEMPEGFERQKLVYKNIKALGIHKPAVAQQSIQEKVDSNRRGPYYQPSGVGTSPYASQSDFSAGGQKNAYDKMKELQARIRL